MEQPLSVPFTRRLWILVYSRAPMEVLGEPHAWCWGRTQNFTHVLYPEDPCSSAVPEGWGCSWPCIPTPMCSLLSPLTGSFPPRCFPLFTQKLLTSSQDPTQVAEEAFLTHPVRAIPQAGCPHV